jgi:hypothetical protein
MAVLLSGAAWATEPRRAPPPATEAPEGAIDPRADQALRRMSQYLGGLESLRFETTTVDEKFTAAGQKIQELQESKVMLQRPAELRVDRVSPRGHLVFRYDGRQFSVYNSDKQVYALAPAPTRLDAAIDEVRDRLHVDAPGGDLLVGDPYAELVEGTVTGRYIGLEPIGGVMAHHLAFTKKDVDWQIWIADGPQPVPLRYVITSKDLPGSPQFTLMLRGFQPNAPISADSFAFAPPPGARRVAFAAPSSGKGGRP